VARRLALVLLALAAAAFVQLRGLRAPSPQGAGEAASARLDTAARRLDELVATARRSAASVGGWLETREALAGRRGALGPLFTRLQVERERTGREAPALAVHDNGLAMVAWAGPVGDRRLLGQRAGGEDVFVVAGNVSTRLVAVAQLSEAGGVKGFATAEITLAVRRNIQNRFLADYDRLAAPDAGVEVRYLDVLDPREDPHTDPDWRLLRSSAGRPLAAIRSSDTGNAASARRVATRWGRLLSAVATLALLAWMLEWPSPARLALGATLLRATLLVLGPWAPAPDSVLASSDVFASSRLGPLLRSPIDLVFTTAWLLALAVPLLRVALRSPGRPGTARGVLADLLSPGLLGVVFVGVLEVCRGSAVPLDHGAPGSQALVQATLQFGLLLWLASGAALLASLHLWGGRPAPTRASWLLRLANWAVVTTLAVRFWPEASPLPVAPALAVLFLAVAFAFLADRLQPRLATRPDLRVAALAAAAAALAGILAPSLAHFEEQALRTEIERRQAPLVLRQPEWRRSALAEAQRRADAYEVLEEALPGPRPPQLEELAFAVWSGTELAEAGLPSAVEIQDAAGAPVSRFALSLPTPPLSPQLPASDDWIVSRDRLPLASAERFALHARRRLVYHGEVHGAIHVYVADDLLALPVAGTQDPYSVLFRNTTEPTRAAGVELLAWDAGGALLHSSVDQPSALDAATAARLLAHPAGQWAALLLDGVPHQAFLFVDGSTIFALAYPGRTSFRTFADVVEASSAGALLALGAVALLLVLRSLLGRDTFTLPSVAQTVARRFLLRLFVAFVAVAFVPVVVLQTVVRAFVAERLRREAEAQALSMAAVAKKAVEDFAFFQKGEAPGLELVTDPALVWVASLVRNDLDVFEGGRLLASSKRELYASGLLPPRVSGTVYRDVVLEGGASALQEERIGALAYRVVSVPLSLRPGAPAVLSIPLALREREIQAVLDDLDRSIRLASILFLVAAAGIARTMARRISDPVRELTRATRLVAQGDLTPRLEPRSRDELASLMLAFNQMASDLERQRQDLERSNRLAAWAEMARQVAHEVKNPLTPIQLAAEHLRRVYADSPAGFERALEACTRTILEQVRTLRGIVTEFSAFARPPLPSDEVADLSEVVEAAARPYSGVLPPRVRLELDLKPVPKIRGDRRLLERAVVNLIENALQAVGEAGCVRVSLTADSEEAQIVVEDDGPGLPPEIRERAFEPFFSTKTAGSGLGLPLVRKIAEDHGGSARIENAGSATRAVIRLPILSAPSA